MVQNTEIELKSYFINKNTKLNWTDKHYLSKYLQKWITV